MNPIAPKNSPRTVVPRKLFTVTVDSSCSQENCLTLTIPQKTQIRISKLGLRRHE